MARKIEHGPPRGTNIHAAFKAHKGKVHMIVEGWAASAASLLVMAGDTVTMRAGALMMVHDPANGCWGTAAEHTKMAGALDAMANVYAELYADKTGKTAEEMRAVMRDEVWLSPAEAVAQGFADAAETGNDNDAVEPVAFSGVTAYARAPERIVAMAQARGWANARAMMRGATLPAPQAPAPVASMDPMALMEACQVAGFPQLAAGLMKAGAKPESVKARIEEAGAIAQLCDLTRVHPNMRAALIDGGISLDAARVVVAEARAAADEGIFTDTAHTNGFSGRGAQMAAIDHRAVYQTINNRRG